MYRGLRTKPYPSLQLLRDLKERRGKILLSSDSHDGASLGFRFAEVVQAAKEIGFGSVLVLKRTAGRSLNYYRSLNYHKRRIKNAVCKGKSANSILFLIEALMFSAVTAELAATSGFFSAYSAAISAKVMLSTTSSRAQPSFSSRWKGKRSGRNWRSWDGQHSPRGTESLPAHAVSSPTVVASGGLVSI